MTQLVAGHDEHEHAVHITNFLAIVSSLLHLYTNFTEGDFKLVFDVMLKYLHLHNWPRVLSLWITQQSSFKCHLHCKLRLLLTLHCSLAISLFSSKHHIITSSFTPTSQTMTPSYSPPTLKSATSSLTPASTASTPTSLTHMQTPAIELLASTLYTSLVSFFTPFLHATDAPTTILLPYMLISLQQASVLISTTPYKLANSLETLS
jgi:hypothetical protein